MRAPAVDLARPRADQRIDARRSAQGAHGAQLRLQLAARALDGVARAVALLRGIAALRDGPRHARRHAVQAHQPADQHRAAHRSAGGMKIDRQFAPAELPEQRPQALRSLAVDRAVGCDPLAAALSAGIRLALRDEEDDRRQLLARLRQDRLRVLQRALRRRGVARRRREDDRYRKRRSKSDHQPPPAPDRVTQPTISRILMVCLLGIQRLEHRQFYAISAANPAYPRSFVGVSHRSSPWSP